MPEGTLDLVFLTSRRGTDTRDWCSFNVTIPQVKQSDWIYGIPFIPNNDPPVTLQIGFPIVDMPGCVDMHKDNKDHVSNLPFDKDLVNQDPKGSTSIMPAW